MNDDIDVHDLATLARQLGYDKERVINRLTRRIARDQSYLQYRQQRGRKTSHDEMLAEDVTVTALAILMLEGKQG